MRTLLAVTTLSLSALAGAAFAADRLSDTDYVHAARCIGLAEASGVDTSALKSVLKAQSRGRMDFVVDRADTARRDAGRQIKKATGEDLGRLTTERDSACAELVSAS